MSDLQLSDSYLRLQLTSKISSALLLEHVLEVLVMPVEQVTLMPSMPEYVLGLMNRRSKVLWAVDLPQMLGLDKLGRNIQQYHIVIARIGNNPLGLAVQQVRGVIRLKADEIKSPLSNSTPNLIPYLRGCSDRQKESLLVLDTKAIINAPILTHV